MYRFYLNSVELSDQPHNWKSFTLEVVYSEDYNYFSIQTPQELDFSGDGYNAILEAYQNNGHCQTLDFLVERLINGRYETIIDGLIIVADCLFQLDKRIVKTKVIDKSFQSRIDNNKSIKTFLESGQGKNSTVGNQILITSPTPITITISGNSREVYDVKDALEYLIAFCSDGSISFASDWYDNLPVDEKISITNGLNIRSLPVGGITLETSFNDLYTDLKNAYNLYLYYDESTTTLYMENENHLEDLKHLVQVDNIREIELSFDQSKLYNGVKMGSPKSKTLGLTYQNPRFVSTVSEEYWFQSKCNTDKAFDITIQNNIIDNNTIHDVVGGDTSFDDDNFLLQYNSSTLVAIETDPAGLGGANVTYNEQLMNHNVATRYGFYDSLSYLIGAISGNYFAADDPEFDSGVYTTDFNIEPVRVRDDHTGALVSAHDTNNNYGNGTPQGNDVSQANSRYTAPANDVYGFYAVAQFQVIFQFAGANDLFPVYTLKLKRYNSANVLLDSKSYSKSNFSVSGATYNVGGAWQTYMDATDYVQLEFDVDYTGATISAISKPRESIFICEYITSSGGTFISQSTLELKNSIVRFKTFLTDQQILDIKNNPQNPILIGDNSYIQDQLLLHKSTKINTTTNEVEFELRSKADLL